MLRFIRIIDYSKNSYEPPRYIENKGIKYYCERDDIVMIRYGDAGKVCRGLAGLIANNLFKISPLDRVTKSYLYYFLSSDVIQHQIRGDKASTTMPAITHKSINALTTVLAPTPILGEFESYSAKLDRFLICYQDQLDVLQQLKSIVLQRMSKA